MKLQQVEADYVDVCKYAEMEDHSEVLQLERYGLCSSRYRAVVVVVYVPVTLFTAPCIR